MIHLALGRLELDWGKNSGFSDHSALFQESDVANVPYYYAGETHSEPDPTGRKFQIITQYKEGLSKPLLHIVDRLSLLGYSKRYAATEFEFLMQMHECQECGLSFNLLSQALATVDLQNVSPDYGEGGEDFGKFFRREIEPRLNLKTLVGEGYQDFDLAYAMENLTPYTVMQLLIDNPTAHGLNVNWQYNDVAENGWAKRNDFVRPLAASDSILIVTEGSSDAKILRHALSLLRPHVADFFRFVDMEEGYPFTGTGNVYKFVQGLISIAVQNHVVVLYDNDAEGNAGFTRTQGLNIPANMRVAKLPDLNAFRKFQTEGPSGATIADINGRAAAIECYLDLSGSPTVRWTGFNHKQDAYQGELIGKDDYARKFLQQRNRSVSYDYSKIEGVLDMIVETCAAMKENEKLAELTRAAR